MGIFKRCVAQYRYQRAMKQAGKQLAECLDIYERNNKNIEEIKALIEAYQKTRGENTNDN